VVLARPGELPGAMSIKRGWLFTLFLFSFFFSSPFVFPRRHLRQVRAGAAAAEAVRVRVCARAEGVRDW
jgi:hypothetical protein